MLLTGEPPFTGASVVEVCGHHLHTPPPPLGERSPHSIPADLEHLVRACLAKSRDERPADATALRRALLASAAAESWTTERAAAWWRARGKTIVTEARGAVPSTRLGSPSVILTRAVGG